MQTPCARFNYLENSFERFSSSCRVSVTIFIFFLFFLSSLSYNLQFVFLALYRLAQDIKIIQQNWQFSLRCTKEAQLEVFGLRDVYVKNLWIKGILGEILMEYHIFLTDIPGYRVEKLLTDFATGIQLDI